MEMKWKSWDVIWWLFNYNVLPALLPQMPPISVHLCLAFSYICYRMQIFYTQIKTSYRIRSVFSCGFCQWIGNNTASPFTDKVTQTGIMEMAVKCTRWDE